jgi:ABC-type maltose transport system permease subunit
VTRGGRGGQTVAPAFDAEGSDEHDNQRRTTGAVVATVPIMVLFLGLERFMTKGLTAGSVKG